MNACKGVKLHDSGRQPVSDMLGSQSDGDATEVDESLSAAGASPQGRTQLGASPQSEAVSTVLAEVLPGIAVVFGDVPPELAIELIDLGLVSATDRTQLTTILVGLGSTVTLAGNLGDAFAGAKGLYRLSTRTQALIDSGAKLASKDGAYLGAMTTPSGGLTQARFIPVTGLSAMQTAAAIGPAVATIALQVQLAEITSLVKKNYALTGQVLATLHRGQRAELAGLVEAIDLAVERARELQSVPASLWDDVAGKGADLRAVRNLYRDNIRGHIAQLGAKGSQAKGEYLHQNAEEIVLDSTALLSSLKAWTGYQALHAGKARTAGREDPDEVRLVDIIARDTRRELSASLDEVRELVDALTRELKIVAELPGRRSVTQTLSLSRGRGELKASRSTSALLLERIAPLADALHPPPAPLDPPAIVCADAGVDLDPFLRILRWFLDDNERIRVLGLPDRPGSPNAISAAVDGARDKLATVRDKPVSRSLIVVTDRRVLTADSLRFLELGEVATDLPLTQIRYIRATRPARSEDPSVVDVITRDENLKWEFPSAIAGPSVEKLAAVLSESMNLPEKERFELQRSIGLGVDEA